MELDSILCLQTKPANPSRMYSLPRTNVKDTSCYHMFPLRITPPVPPKTMLDSSEGHDRFVFENKGMRLLDFLTSCMHQSFREKHIKIPSEIVWGAEGIRAICITFILGTKIMLQCERQALFFIANTSFSGDREPVNERDTSDPS